MPNLNINGKPVICTCDKCRQRAAKKRARRDHLYMAVGIAIGLVAMWFHCASFA